MRGHQRLGVEPTSRERARQEILRDHVSPRDERPHERLVARVIEVGGDTPLVAIDAQEVGALSAVVERWSPPTRVVTRPWPFNLDHVGTQVAEHHGADGSRQHPREIEYSNRSEIRCGEDGRAQSAQKIRRARKTSGWETRPPSRTCRGGLLAVRSFATVAWWRMSCFGISLSHLCLARRQHPH